MKVEHYRISELEIVRIKQYFGLILIVIQWLLIRKDEDWVFLSLHSAQFGDRLSSSPSQHANCPINGHTTQSSFTRAVPGKVGAAHQQQSEMRSGPVWVPVHRRGQRRCGNHRCNQGTPTVIVNAGQHTIPAIAQLSSLLTPRNVTGMGTVLRTPNVTSIGRVRLTSSKYVDVLNILVLMRVVPFLKLTYSPVTFENA